MQKRSPSIFIESDRKQEKRSCERFNYRMWDLLRVANRQSFSNAEVFEDIPQYFVGLYFSAGDFSEMVEAAAEVLADEVWREAGGESADDAVDVGESRL